MGLLVGLVQQNIQLTVTVKTLPERVMALNLEMYNSSSSRQNLEKVAMSNATWLALEIRVR